jgi:DNA processing protein
VPPALRRYDLHAIDLPPRLRQVDRKLDALDVIGNLDAPRAVAIVGSRGPTDQSREYATHLAGELARRDVVVVSGGAVGIDKAAHEGALDAGGRTWCVLATTHPQITPPENVDLFHRIAANGGSLVWIGAGRKLARSHFLQRNNVLVSLCDAVVVIQAAEQSGSRNAASCARRQHRALWVAAPPPWHERAKFRGNILELRKPGTHALIDEDELFRSLELSSGPVPELAQAQARKGPAVEPAPLPPPPPREDKVELAILRTLHDAGDTVLHVDEIVAKSALPYPAAAAALLTLCLEAVVVEGPGGFYRRREVAAKREVGKR